VAQVQIKRIENYIQNERDKEKEGPVNRWTSIHSSEDPIKFLYHDSEKIVFQLQQTEEAEPDQDSETLIDEVDKDNNLWGSKKQKDTQAFIIELML
jgi:hypothetical protein